MNQRWDEGVAIARLYGDDQSTILGLVYLWNTSEIAILWTSDTSFATFICAPIRPETLISAQETTPNALLVFLRALKVIDI